MTSGDTEKYIFVSRKLPEFYDRRIVVFAGNDCPCFLEPLCKIVTVIRTDAAEHNIIVFNMFLFSKIEAVLL